MAQNDPIFVSHPVVEQIPAPQPLGKARHAGIAAGGTSAALIALALAVAGLKPDEGLRTKTYLDVAKIPTYCFGHADRSSIVGTQHAMAQCNALLDQDVGKAQKAVGKCTPGLQDHPVMWAAATRLTYNIGTAAYCRSSIAKNFNAGNLKAGCIGFLDWRFAAGKPVLLARREREESQCLEGL